MQFSNDVRVEVPPQSLSLEDLKGRLDELVRRRLTPFVNCRRESCHHHKRF